MFFLSASFRGQATLQPLVTGNQYISGLQLTITNVQIGYDSQIYKCTADNRRGNKGSIDEREIVINVEWNQKLTVKKKPAN